MQKVVSNNIEVGIKGELLKGLHSYNLQWSGFALDSNIAPGNFVKVDETNDNGVWSATGAGVGAGEKIVGVALRHYISACNADVETFPKGDTVFYVIRGAVWIETSITAKVGQNVFIKDSDGTLAFDNAETLANHTPTGFKVLRATPAGVSADTPALVAIYK